MRMREMRVGAVVEVKGYEREGTRVIERLYPNIPGGVRLDRPVDGILVSWNIEDLRLVRPDWLLSPK